MLRPPGDWASSRIAKLSIAPIWRENAMMFGLHARQQMGAADGDQVQKFLGHRHLSTMQIYAETSLRAPATTTSELGGDGSHQVRV